jgi:hypothetical protein
VCEWIRVWGVAQKEHLLEYSFAICKVTISHSSVQHRMLMLMLMLGGLKHGV